MPKPIGLEVHGMMQGGGERRHTHVLRVDPEQDMVHRRIADQRHLADVMRRDSRLCGPHCFTIVFSPSMIVA